MIKQRVGSSTAEYTQPSPARDDKKTRPEAAGGKHKPNADRPADEAPEPNTDPWNEGP